MAFGGALDAGYGPSEFLERLSRRSGISFQDFDDRADKALVFPNKFTLRFQIEALVEEAKSGEEKQLALVETEREVHTAFFEELDDLNNVLA